MRCLLVLLAVCCAGMCLVGCTPASQTIGGQPILSQDGIDVYYVPLNDFATYLPQVEPGNWGYFYQTIDNRDEITHVTVLIATDVTTQADRNHLIREEVTQGCGLMSDSYLYPDSMFYQGWTDTPTYSDMDKAIIQMLYRPDIQPGMTHDQAAAVLQGQYTPAELEYFDDIAFAYEFGTGDGRLKKWTHSTGIRVHGQPTDTDLAALQQVATDLLTITGNLDLTIDQ